MKTEMSEDGVITIRPESSVEAYALRRWVDSALINVDDAQRCENSYWKGSRLAINAELPAKNTIGIEPPEGILNFLDDGK